MRTNQQQTQNNRLNIQSLQVPAAWEAVVKIIDENSHKLQLEHVVDLDGEIKWIKIKETIISIQQETKNTKRKKFMTKEILTLMDERKRHKNK